jgi:hypothetical protein
MAIFGRRTTQRLIDETGPVVSKRQIRKLVDDLNAMPQTQTLSPDWELILLNVFSKIGRVKHEESLGGPTKPDLFFECTEHPQVSFVADIRTVSDKGFKAANPFGLLFDELMRLVQKRGLRPLSFRLDAEGNYRAIQKGQFYIDPEDETQTILYRGGIKTKLKLPGAAKFSEIVFDQKFDQFLSDIETSPEIRRTLHVKGQLEDIDLTISYDPNQMFAGGGHLEYRRINHLTQNPLYQALEDKSAQVIDSKFEGTLGIIICDGGFTPFHSLPHFSTHSVEEVISYFLTHNPRISFVLTFILKKESQRAGAPIQIATKIYSSATFKAQEDDYVSCLNEMIQFFPSPRVDSFNALNRLKGKFPHEGGYMAMQNQQFRGNAKRVVISARILLELLAGRMTYDEFAERYGFVAVYPFPSRGPNPFELSLNNGALITDVAFQTGNQESDDDVVIITLNDEADPAISPFRYPPMMTTTMHGG